MYPLHRFFPTPNFTKTQLFIDPWIVAEQRYRPGQTVIGTLAEITATGISIRIEDGIEGFIDSGHMNLPVGTVLSENMCLVDISQNTWVFPRVAQHVGKCWLARIQAGRISFIVTCSSSTRS